MIAFDQMSKSYRTGRGHKVILDRLTMTLPTDRNIGVLGRNGAGKSTLMRLIARAEAPSSGRISSDCSISWPLAFSGGFQNSLSALDNIRFVSRIYGQDWQAVVQQVETFAELGDYMTMPVKTFSSGMRARLSLGLSLAIDFDVYLVDEIPGVGDARFKKRFEDAFEQLCSRATLFLTSHSVASVRKHCEVGLVLHEGKLTIYDDIEEALAVYERL